MWFLWEHKSKNTQAPSQWDPKNLIAILRFFYDACTEIIFGLFTRQIPHGLIWTWGLLLMFMLMKNWDQSLLSMIAPGLTVPHGGIPRVRYVLAMGLSGYLFWGLWQSALKQRMQRRLTMALHCAGLKNHSGTVPGFIADRRVDAETRRLRLSRAHLPLEQFQKGKSALESSLQVYIEEITEDREKGTVSIVYAHTPMDEVVKPMLFTELSPHGFEVGRTRSRMITASLREVPHLLIAGQTGGGKSTFLRQMITNLYLRNDDYQFSLVDLKGALEFQTFEGLPRTRVFGSFEPAAAHIIGIADKIDQRMKAMHDLRVKDLDHVKEKKPFSRLMLVIDEAGEMFLAGPGTNPQRVTEVRGAVSRIARLGRAIGIHLVIGTQRPDARVLDTQIKANLPAKICFKMADIASSLVVLDSARAKDLPGIPGRAIWKFGLDQIQVQTPFMTPEHAQELLQKHRDKSEG